MPKTEDVKKKLWESVGFGADNDSKKAFARKVLYEILDDPPLDWTGTGTDALKYLLEHGVDESAAIQTILEYGRDTTLENVSGPPASTIPTVVKKEEPINLSPKSNEISTTILTVPKEAEEKQAEGIKNIYKAEVTENKIVMAEKEIPKKPEWGEENDKAKITEQQASGVPVDGGGPNCPEGKVWDAETETCKPIQGSVSRDAPPQARSASETKYTNRSANADIKTEKRRVAEYYKKLDRLDALRGLKVADARIAAKERYLKEKRLDRLIKNAKESAVPRARFAPATSKTQGEAPVRKISAQEAEVSGPASWLRAISRNQNVPSSFVWQLNKQEAFETSDQRFVKKFDANDNVEFIPMTSSQKKATEAVTGPPANDFMRIMSEQVLVLPNGKVVTPIRQFCETKILPPGVKEAFFYDFGAVSFSAVTEDGSTQVGESAVVIRSSGGSASPRGTRLTVGYTQLEEAPIDIVAAANRSFALESVNDESVEIVNRAYNTDSGSAGDATNRKAKGAGTKSGRWVDHNGDQITADASGLNTLTFSGLVKAKGVIEDEGLDPSNIITYTTGKAIRDLIFDPDLDSFISFSRPAIITEATVERIAGTNVVRTSALASGTQTSSKRSVMFIPNIAFGLISGRDLTMEAQRRNELQSVFITGTQRIVGQVKNVEATCRISHL